MKTMQNLLSAYTAELTTIKEKLGRSVGENKMTTNPTLEVQNAIEHLISSLPTIIIGLSQDSNIVLWNAKAEDVLGFDAHEVMGLHVSQCGIVWDWDKIADGILQSRYNNRPMRVDDVAFRGPEGDERFLGLTVNPLTDL